MTEEKITSDPTPEADGQSADEGGQEAPDQVSIKDVLGKELGKEFADDASALKAVKDTFSYVGKKGDDVLEAMLADPDKAAELKTKLAPEGTPKNKEADGNIDTSKFISKEQYEEDMFYSQNAVYSPYKAIIKAMANSQGISPNEVVEQDEFKSVFTKSQAYDEGQQSKSILESNPRLGQVTDNLSKAREAMEAGDDRVAGDLATQSVLDAYEVK